MGTELTTNIQESRFYAEIKELLLQARSRAYMAVNSIMSQTYWQIGKRIVEQEQKGSYRAEYGSRLIKRLAQSLAALVTDSPLPISKTFDVFISPILTKKKVTHCVAF